ncbi:MAG: hypothetical protein ACLSE8_00120 [Parasutterella sp.]
MQSTSFTVNSAQINLNGLISGGGSGGADATFSGDVKAKGIGLTEHVHSGVGKREFKYRRPAVNRKLDHAAYSKNSSSDILSHGICS